MQWFSTDEWNMAPALLIWPCSLFCWDPDLGSFSMVVVDADRYLIPANWPQSCHWIFIGLWLYWRTDIGSEWPVSSVCYRIKFASQALNSSFAPSWWCKAGRRAVGRGNERSDLAECVMQEYGLGTRALWFFALLNSKKLKSTNFSLLALNFFSSFYGATKCKAQ